MNGSLVPSHYDSASDDSDPENPSCLAFCYGISDNLCCNYNLNTTPYKVILSLIEVVTVFKISKIPFEVKNRTAKRLFLNRGASPIRQLQVTRGGILQF